MMEHSSFPASTQNPPFNKVRKTKATISSSGRVAVTITWEVSVKLNMKKLKSFDEGVMPG